MNGIGIKKYSAAMIISNSICACAATSNVCGPLYLGRAVLDGYEMAFSIKYLCDVKQERTHQNVQGICRCALVSSMALTNKPDLPLLCSAAGQYESAFKATRLANWEVSGRASPMVAVHPSSPIYTCRSKHQDSLLQACEPGQTSHKPCRKTDFIVDERGHLLPGVVKKMTSFARPDQNWVRSPLRWCFAGREPFWICRVAS